MKRKLTTLIAIIIIGSLLLWGTLNAHAVSYSFTDIDFPGAGRTLLQDINDSGLIVGDFIDASGNSHGLLYNGTTFTRLDDFPGSSPTDRNHFYGINNAGTTVGFVEVPDGHRGFKYDGTTFTPINFPGFDFTRAVGITDSDIILVQAQTPTPENIDLSTDLLYDGTTFSTLNIAPPIAAQFPGVSTTPKI